MSTARAGFPGSDESFASRGSLVAGLICTRLPGSADDAASRRVNFNPAVATIDEPLGGVGGSHCTAPASPFATVPESRKTVAQIAPDTIKSASFFWLPPPTARASLYKRSADESLRYFVIELRAASRGASAAAGGR